MATELEIRVTAELTQIKASLAQLTTSIANVNAKANQGGQATAGLATGMGKAATEAKKASSASDQMAGSIDKAKTSLAGLLAGLGLVAVTKGLVTMADTYTRLTGQIKLATKNTAELNTAQEATFEIAQRTRQGLEATVNLFARIARAGKTNLQGTLQLTESINQAVSLSFTSASAGEAALFQLGQALASGTLRGDELNSVLEQTPRLAAAIADGLVKLGKIKDPGDLRNYAAKNGIAAADVVAAIQSQRDKLTKEFAQLTPTVADAFTALRNAVLKFVGDTNTASGATNTLAGYILVLANNVDKIAAGLILAAKLWLTYKLAIVGIPAIIDFFSVAAVGAGAAGTAGAVGVAEFTAAEIAAGAAATGSTGKVALFGTTMNAAGLKAIGLKGILKGLVGVIGAAFTGWEIGTYLKEQYLQVELFGIALAAGLTKVGNNIKNNFLQVGAVIKAVFTESFNYVLNKTADLFQAVADAQSKLPGIGDKLAGVTEGVVKKLKGSLVQSETVGAAIARINAKNLAENAAIDASYGELADAAIAARVKTKAVSDGDTGGGKPKAVAGIKAIIDQYALLKDAADRALKHLDQLYADNLVTIRGYYAEKQRLQQAGIDADIAAARAEAAAAKDGKAKGAALTKIIQLERERRDVALQSTYDQGKAEQDLADKLQNVQVALLNAQGQGAKAKALELEAQYKDLLARLDVEADTAGKALVHKLINVEAAKAGLDQFKKEYTDATSALAQVQATTSAQVSAGLLSNATAEKRVKEARDATLQQLQDQRQAVADLYAQYKDPDTLQYLRQLDQQIAELSVSTDDWRGKLQDASTDSLTTFFKDLASGAVSAGDAIKNLAVNFTQALAQMAAQALAKKAIQALFDLFTKDDASTSGGDAAAADKAVNAGKSITSASIALGLAGAVVTYGGNAIKDAATELTAAATLLLIANTVGSASVAHTGGVVGSLGNMRNVSSWMYAGAPRYHTGGIAGLKSDEVPAVLKRGEEVLTRNDPRHRYNNGNGQSEAPQPKSQRFIFLDDQRKVKDYMTSPEGEEVFLEVLSRNGGAVRELLKG